MVKVLQLLSVGIAAGDDSSALLQQSLAREHSVGNRLLAAIAHSSRDTICVKATVGDIAPVPGSFTATKGQQAVEVAAGAVAEESGSFCVAKASVLLLQRTYSLHTAQDIDSALSTKKDSKTTTTTTTTAEVSPNAENYATFDFAGDTQKTVMVEQCPDKSSTLTQMMEVTVSKKGQATPDLDADQMRVCACRNFLKDGVQHISGISDLLTADQMQMEKEMQQAAGITTNGTPTMADFGTVCKQAAALNDWTLMAKMINDPTEVVPDLQAVGVTGQEHCAKSWIIKGACAEIVKETSLLQR